MAPRDATDLAVFKARFSRSKDWVDIEAMVREEPPSLDLVEAVSWLTDIVVGDDPRVTRLRSLSGERRGP